MARAILFLISLSFLFLLPSFISGASPSGPADTELFYCVDWDCQEFISRGKTLLNYAGRTDKHLSFRQNEDIKILSKSIDENGADWIGMVRRKIGLVPKTMVREDQMGKHPSKFQYPFHLLPLWPKVDPNAEQKPEAPPVLEEKVDEAQQEEESKSEEVNSTVVDVKEEDSTVRDETEKNSSSVVIDAKEESAPEVPELKSDGTVLPEVYEYDNTAPHSVEPIIDVADPVMPDELQKQENVEPTETVDHEMPEIPEATAVPEEQNEAELQEVIEPTKASTLDQIITSATEVVVEPSETVDLKDSQEIENQNNEPVVQKEPPTESPPVVENVPEKIESQPESLHLHEEINSKLPSEVTEEPEKLKEGQVSESPEAAEPVESQSPSEILQDEPSEQEVSDSNNDPEVVQNQPELHIRDEPTTESPITSTKSEEEIPDPHETNQVEPSGTTETELKQEDVESITTPPVPDISEDSQKSDQPEGPVPPTEDESTTTESSMFTGWFGSPAEEEVPVTESPEIKHPVEPEETVTPLSVVEDKPKEDVSGGTFPDKTAPEPGTFASWFEETAQLTESNSNIETVQPAGDETTTENVIIASQTEAPVVHEETTSELPVQLPEPVETVAESPATEAPVIQDEPKQEELVVETTTTSAPAVSDIKNPLLPEPELSTHEDEHHHHHHHHHHEHKKSDDSESSSFIVVVKHLSSTLLSFLPEHLQDTILDVDDALVFTGIIALTLVSICVPYFLIEGFFSVRPLKKKVVELNKSLWKVSTAYENQQEEFEVYKKKALAYDEDKKRVEQLEYELLLLKKLESKQKEQVTSLKKELKSSAQVAEEVQSLVETTMDRKKKALEERERLKTTVISLKEALRRTTDELQEAQAEGSSAVMDLELARQSNETLCMKVDVLEKEVGELKSKLVSEVDRRRAAEDERDEASKSKSLVENELSELRKICHKYEETVSDLNIEISHKENELAALKDTLGDESPLVDIAEVKAKLVNAEEEAASLQSRVETFTLENNSLSRNLKEATSSLSSIQKEKDEALNRLQVLEAWFKEKEEELRKAVERYEAEKNIRGKDKDDLVRMIEEKSDESRDLNERVEALKEEFEETKQQHRNEIRALEAKSHENWLSLCQAERKAQDARKEAEFLRQTLTALSKEKEGDGDELNGDVPMYPLITPDMVPLPLPDDSPSYYGLGLGEGFMPPPPLDEEREPHRPAPLGRLSPYSDLDDNILSPIRRDGRGEGDYSDADSSASDSPRHRRRSPPRGGWVDRDRDRDDRRRRGHSGPRASSPVSQGFNL